MSVDGAEKSPHWSSPLCHVLPLSAVLLLAVNDHWLKGSGVLPGWLAGKISDAAGLFFFPALLVTIYMGFRTLAGRRARWSRWPAVVSVLVTGLIFTAANCWTAFNELLASLSMCKVMDPSDLLTLPVLVLAWIWLESRRAAQP
jgi:hypothetical protein